jgi:peptidoglycan-associated lipoprotein
MSNLRSRLALPLLAAVLFSVTACAPGHSIVRGNWPDGRLDAPARARAAATPVRVPDRAAASTAPNEEWLPATGDANGMSAAELNRMDVLQTIHFDYDSDRVRPNQTALMEMNAAWLLDNPDARIIVEGHCDERGTREYNLALGQRRAMAAANFLVSLGVDPGRIEAVSFGEELPAAPGHNERAWAANRRAVFVISAIGAY